MPTEPRHRAIDRAGPAETHCPACLADRRHRTQTGWPPLKTGHSRSHPCRCRAQSIRRQCLQAPPCSGENFRPHSSQVNGIVWVPDMCSRAEGLLAGLGSPFRFLALGTMCDRQPGKDNDYNDP
jgi:hypothetical protein